MLNFPKPYPEELLYSTLARAGIRHGILSPKQLLDEIYGNRKVIATLDLPNQLEKVVRWLPLGYDLETIAYRHTLFPLYAPFIPEERRKRCLKGMSGESQGAVHLAMGVTASIVKAPDRITFDIVQDVSESKETLLASISGDVNGKWPGRSAVKGMERC